MADMAEIGQVEDAWEQFVNLGLTDDEGHGITPITYMNSTAAIKAFLRRARRAGLHLVQRQGRIRLGLQPQREDLLPSRSASGPQHGFRARHSARRDGGVGSVSAAGRPDRRAAAQSQGNSVEGPLLGASALSAGARRQSSRHLSRHPGHRPSRVPLGSLPESRRNRLDRSPHQNGASRRRQDRRSPSAPKFTWSIGWRRKIPTSTSSRSTIRAACVPPCFASRRSTCAGRWRTWSTATSSIRSR